VPSDSGLTRRDLLLSGAAAAGYALAARPISADAIRTSADGLREGPVEIAAAGGAMPAYRARPEAGGEPSVVLVVHEIFGVHEYIRDVCRRLARQGYLALAPDLYRRHGDVSKREDIDAILEVVRSVPDAEVLADLDAALAWAGAEGGDTSRSAVTGFCWGGRIVWLYAAHAPSLRAGAAWYGRLEGAASEATPRHPLDVAQALRAPVLGLYGGSDTGIPLESVDAMRARLAEAGGTSEIVVFPGAPHGFHADYRPGYRELAATEAWRRMLAWFREHGVV
jgi:carboxymethylenebutenolidase